MRIKERRLNELKQWGTVPRLGKALKQWGTVPCLGKALKQWGTVPRLGKVLKQWGTSDGGLSPSEVKR